MKILSLTYYPVKSLGPISSTELDILPEGPKWDREWMLVDENGRFVTQRELPKLSLLLPFWRENSLWIQMGNEQFPIPKCEMENPATIWKETLPVAYSDGKEKDWFERNFGARLQFVKLSKPRIPDHGISVRFCDTLPILVCNQSSLVELNQKINSPVDIDRFRANIIVAGNIPWEEDRWQSLENKNLELYREKPCSRCTIVNVDPKSGIRELEPLRTLANERKFNGKVQFGVYFSVRKKGKIRVGESLEAKSF